jgi:thioredoxin-dependent peroxiredoxin
MTISIGDMLPAQTIATSKNENANLSDYVGGKLIVYFYPKDNTSGCTQQGQDFRDHFQVFTKAQCQILGVSRDSLKSHANFIAKNDFPFTLISDQDEQLCKLFDVIKEKNMYGRKYMGIERSTFLFNSQGILTQEWRKVRVKEHVLTVLDAAQNAS